MTTVPNTARVRQALENDIVVGKLVPGERLDPDALAQRFMCSRTPVREALQQLETSGLVQVIPKRGTFISEWSVEELTERFETMAEMEAVCARLAARRITDAELGTLSDIHARCQALSKDEDFDGYYSENSAFHATIYRATHNAFLEQETARLHLALQPYRRMQLQVRNRLHRSFDEHEAIFSAIKSGDGESAATAMRDHVVVQGDRFHDLVAALRNR